MLINKVTLTNFCQHAQREDEFGPGIIGIIGPNGSGKSNYVKSILRGITGSSGNPGRKEEDVTWGQEKGLVEVEFSVNGRLGIVKRQLASASCHLKYDDKTVRTAREVDQLLESLLGIDKHVLTDMVFVQQGAIEGILFQRPADRAKALQNLFGTASAEALRTLLLDEITTTHIESRAEPIARLESLMLATQNRLDEINTRLSAAQSLSFDRIDVLRASILDYRARAQAKENLKSMEAQLEAGQGGVSEVSLALGERRRFRDELRRTLDSARNDYEASQKRIQSQQAIRLRMEDKARLLKEKAQLAEQLAQPEPVAPAVSPERLADLAAHCEELRASIAVSRKVISNQEGECPTCRQPITAAHIGRHRLSLASEEPQLSMYDKELKEQKALLDSYAQDRFRWTVSHTNAKNNMERVEGRLKTLEDTDLTPIDVSDDLKFVGSFQNSEKLEHSVSVEIGGLEARHQLLKQQCSQILDQVNRLRAQAGDVELPDVLKLEAELRQLEQERETFSRLQGEKAELIRRLTVDAQQLEGYKNEESATAARRDWRSLLERVRMVLHRDQLPNIVAQAYLGALNAKLADYLSIFESPFTAQIKTDISIECQFLGGHAAQAERLSGGQKVMLGIAFRFAIYDLFAQSLGFMVLDEPTVYLDSDHVESVFTLLERVKSYSATAGLQLIVVTHEMRLAGIMDKVINLGLVSGGMR